MRLRELAPGRRFRQPSTGLTGQLVALGAVSARIRLERFREIVIRGERKGRAAETAHWSLETEVEPLPVRGGQADRRGPAGTTG